MHDDSKWVIWRFQNGISLNPKEYVRDEYNIVLGFDTAGEALNYFLGKGGDIEAINHGVSISKEEV